MPARMLLCAITIATITTVGLGDGPIEVVDYAKLPANVWTLIRDEPGDVGKTYARLINTASVDRLYLWGVGGKKAARNVYARYELESFSPAERVWREAFPASKADTWKSGAFPPFRFYGYSGPDGLKPTEGPRLRTVGGSAQVNTVWWHDFDGVKRPSPILTFNQACWDSKRNRIVYFADDQTFALDPATNTWTDLKAANHPACCKTLAWASLCYDAINDEILLFGGGLATNYLGGAQTWLYDCAKNEWRRPKMDVEPELRCVSPIVYNHKLKTMVMFGGYDQASALNDTWVYHCKDRRWERRTPASSPPPMYAPATAAIPGSGKVLIVGPNALLARQGHSRLSAAKQTWVYDVAADTWTPIGEDLNLQGHDWLTATGSDRHGVVFLTAFGQRRKTFALRYDPSAPPMRREGRKPGTRAWRWPTQRSTLAAAPPADEKAHARVLAALPVNTFVDAKPPGTLIAKTWSSACIDTDRGEVVYIGGGHSGYSGNDVARYSIAANRWTLDYPPRFPPFLDATNATVFGWTYGRIPFSQHTYLWYNYDPVSKTILYLARPTLHNGLEVQLTDDPKDRFVYDRKKHLYWNWVYDQDKRAFHRPSFGRPFANPWALCLTSTPKGIYALASGKLYFAKVSTETGGVKWTLVDSSLPKPKEKIRYNYEFQPMLHDTRRDRLVVLKGAGDVVHIYARPLTEGAKWTQLQTTGKAAIGREAVYIEKHDTILWLADRRLFAFECATNTLSELDVDLPKGSYNHECALVYDSARDVCVALIPSRFTGPMQTLLFRYDVKTAERK